MSLNQNGTSGGSSPQDAETTPLDVAKAAVGDPAGPGDEQEPPASETPAEAADENKDPAKEKWDPLAVVKKAVADTKKSEDKPEEGAGEQDAEKSSKSEDGQNQKPGETEELGEITDEELKSYKPKTRRRIEGLLEDRQSLTDEVNNLKPIAEQYQILTGYMTENNLSEGEFADLMVVGAMAKSQKPEDLQFAIGKTKEFLEKLELVAGVRLPNDLQEKVDEGHMTAEGAGEIAKARITSQRAEQTVTEVKTKETKDEFVQAVTTVNNAVDDWQKNKIATDPDYRTIEPFLAAEMASRVAKEKDGRVLNRDKALQIAEESYKAVATKLKKAIPNPPPKPKTVLTSRSAPGNMASQPGSALEAAKQGLAKMRK